MRLVTVPRLAGLFLLFVLSGVSLSGCDAERVEITERRVVGASRVVGFPPSDERFAAAAMLDQDAPPVTPSGMPAAPPPAPPAPAVAWDTPPDWKPLPSTPLRLINFAVPGGGECYVSVLAGGGGLLPNVNRWRSQIGAPPLDAAGVEALPRLTLLGRPAVWVELEGTYQGPGEPPRPGWAVLGLLQEGEGSLLTVKLIGPSAAAAAQREAFQRFCASLRIESP